MRRTRLIGKFCLFFATYFLLLSYCIVFNNEAGWSLFFFLTLLLLADLLFTLPSLNKIQVTLEESIQTQRNQETPLPLQVFNYRPTLLPIPKLTLRFQEQEQTLTFYRGESFRLEVLWLPTARGVYSGLPVTLTSHDLWGIFKKKRILQLQQELLVLPENKPEVISLLTLFEKQVRKYTYGEPNFTIRNYRNYQQGDSLKHIDWKLSSKQQELIYREHEMEQQQELTLLFWGESHALFEETLALFFSLHNLLYKKIAFQPVLIGEKLASPYQVRAGAFAAIQPFTATPQQLPKISGHHVIILAPVISSALEAYRETMVRGNTLQIYTYQDLIQRMARKEVSG
jgi:hypothetical protein